MIYVPLEKLLDKSNYSIYKLVIMASKRALEIAEGQPRMVTVNDPSIDASTIALLEIADGKVQMKK